MTATIQKILKPTKYRAVDTAPNNLYSSNLANDFTNVSFDSFSFVNGVLTLTATGSDVENVAITNPVDVTAGDEFLVSFTISSGGGTGVYFKLGPDSNLNSADFTTDALSNGTYSFTMSSSSLTDSTSYFGFRSNGSHNGTLVITDISIKKIGNNGNNHGQIYSGRALKFDGVADYLSTGYNAKTNGITNNWTAVCWLKSDSFSTNQFALSFYQNSSDGLNLRIDTSGDIHIYEDIDGGDAQVYPTRIELNTWYRAVMVMDNLELKLYINGILVGSGTNASDGLDSFESDLLIGARSTSAGNEYWFSGMMSDFQMWNAVWTQSDVTYDYLNPESLALNNGGTSLTESNLKLWYPMQDGHRGQQSYIMDGANTGLGDELATNADMNPDGAGWRFNNKWESGGNSDGSSGALNNVLVSTTFPYNDVANESVFYTTFDNKQVMYFKCIDADPSSSNEIVDQSFGVVKGVTYKFHVRVWVIQGQLRAWQSNSRFQNDLFQTSSTTGQWEDMIGYLTCDNDDDTSNSSFNIGVTSGGSVECYIDFASAKPVNDKHHATTEFKGDELITTTKDKNMDADNNWIVTDAQWSYDGTNDELDYTAGAAGHVFLAESYPNLIAGRTYEFRFANDNTSNNTKITIRDGRGSELITSDYEDNGTFDNDHGNWATYGANVTRAQGSSAGASGGGLIITPTDTSESHQGVTLGTGSFETLTAGKEYILSVDIKGNSNDLTDFYLRAGGVWSSSFSVTSSFATYRHAFTASSDAAIIITNRNDGTDPWYIDNVSLKELGANTLIAEATYSNGEKYPTFIAPADTTGLTIEAASDSGAFAIESINVKEMGVASGWTDADQQLDIPQTALQSYNQLAWGANGGANESSYVNVDPEPNFGTADFSISYSVLFNDATETIRFYSASTATTVRQLKNGLMRLYVSDGVGNQVSYTTVTQAGVFESGKWYHIVENWNYSGSDWVDVKVYVNGEYQGIALDISGLDGSAGLNMTGNHRFGGYSNPEHLSGAMNEIAYWKGTNLSKNEINELYNGGKILDARDHSKADTKLINYWRNNGLAQWKDLKGSAHSINNYFSETLLLPAGVDSSRDSQGFIMNRQKDTNSLNLYDDDTANEDLDSPYVKRKGNAIDDWSAFSISAWVKTSKFTEHNPIVHISDSSNTFAMMNVSSTGALGASFENGAGVTLRSVSAGSQILSDTWTHITCCYNYGVDNGSGNNSNLTDTTANFTVDDYHVGGTYARIKNITQNTYGNIQGNTSTGMTTSMASGDWDANDKYMIVKYYVNGQLITTSTDNFTGFFDASVDEEAIKIGRGDKSGSYRTFDGEVDDVLIYSKVLTHSEVDRIYNAGKRSHRNPAS